MIWLSWDKCFAELFARRSEPGKKKYIGLFTENFLNLEPDGFD